MIRVATLFSGVGTPEQSLKHLKVEHETVFACEIDKYARTTYLANNQEPKTFYDDVKKLDATKYLNKIDILIWGFPCTSFSIAGKQLGFDDSFIFPQKMSDTQLYKQAGNGMSRNILDMIFTQIFKSKNFDLSSNS